MTYFTDDDAPYLKSYVTSVLLGRMQAKGWFQDCECGASVGLDRTRLDSQASKAVEAEEEADGKGEARRECECGAADWPQGRDQETVRTCADDGGLG